MRAGVRDARRLEHAARRRLLARRLPSAARRYVEFVEEQLEVEVSLVGTGAEREAVLAARGVEAVARP